MTERAATDREGVVDDLEGSVGLDVDDGSSRRWRSLWRIHFYSGMFALPFILLMAVTGLVILYTQPLNDLTQGDLRSVSVPSGAEYQTLEVQEAAVEAAYPDGTVLDVTPPAGPERSTRFFVDDGSKDGRHVFVDPYSAEVLGDVVPTGGIIGLSNRLHGYLNNDSITVSLPAVAALWDDGAVMRDYVLGDLILEILGVWTLVLVFSGLYIWWPRRSSRGERRPVIRRGAAGRARWRDLHGLGGVALLSVMCLTIISGLGWSTYWAEQFNSLAETLTPGVAVEQPASALGVRGDLDRFGNQIPWATGEFPIPASYAPSNLDGSAAAPLSLDAVAAIAVDEGMKPGYTISFPSNTVDEAGNEVLGSYALYNSWPRQTGDARDLFLDQFSGETLAEQNLYGMGTIYKGMDYLVSTHMGTQLGIFSRIFMTALCLLSIWSVVSAAAMYLKRRRPGSLGLPRRPVDVRLARGVAVIAVVTGIVFPQWGVTAVVILAADRWLVRRVAPLRRMFGQLA